jgi:hypothetical protein
MERKTQTLAELLDRLSPLPTEWEDETATKTIAVIEAIAPKPIYDLADLESLLDADFKIGTLVARLFLGISDDDMETGLHEALGDGGTGVKRYKADKAAYMAALVGMGVLDAMDETVNRPATWSDVLVERLRSGRGKAVRGQRRGRNLENFVETIVESVFGAGNYETRCQFSGATGKPAKCDFAIPTKSEAIILIEVKGYGATGSKMTDVMGDLVKILEQKRNDTILMLFTDGETWKRRTADLKKLVELQNRGQIARIYTTLMADEFRADLLTLKAIHKL